MDYWKKRTLANEEKASRLAASYAKRQRQALEKAYKQIENYLNALYVQINYGGADKITRTQLWQYSKYLELEQQIRKELNNVAIQQIEDIKEVTQRVFEETLETDLEELLGTSKHYSINSESLMKQNLNSAWSGLDYSKRVWINTNELAERLKNDINDMIVLGKSPNQIKEALMWDFNTAYDVADRLVRTEASYAFNSANMASYKAAGLQYIKLLPERDEKLCSRCRELANENGGIYEINEAPTLPVHPRCRCCYSPYAKLDASEYKAQKKVEALQKANKELKFYKRSVNHQQHAEIITGLKGDAAWNKYEKLASDFIKKDIDGIKVEGFVSKEGTLFKYEKDTNTFGMLSNKGTISTMFYPIEKEDYWKTQINKYKGV